MNGSDDTRPSDGCFPPEASPLETFVLTHLCLVFCICGIPLNVLTLFVLKMDKSKTTTRFLLIVLAVHDLLLIILYLLYYILNHYTDVFHLIALSSIRHADSVFLFFVQWIKFSESYLIILVSIDRFIAILMPLKAARLSTVPRVAKAVLGIVVVSCLLKLPNLVFDYQIAVVASSCNFPFYMTQPVFANTSWYKTYITVYPSIIDQITSFMIPLLLLTVLNVCLILHLRHNNVVRNTYLLEAGGYRGPTRLAGAGPAGVREALDPQQRRLQAHNRRNASQRSITFTLIGVITVFVICELPAVFHFFFKLYSSMANVSLLKLPLARYNYISTIPLMIINCSVNFFIYVLTGRKFRRLCLRTVRVMGLKLRRACCPCLNSHPAFDENQTHISLNNTEAFAYRTNCSGVHTPQMVLRNRPS